MRGRESAPRACPVWTSCERLACRSGSLRFRLQAAVFHCILASAKRDVLSASRPALFNWQRCQYRQQSNAIYGDLQRDAVTTCTCRNPSIHAELGPKIHLQNAAMVRKGSPVRVRRWALNNLRANGASRRSLPHPDTGCGYDHFRLKGRGHAKRPLIMPAPARVPLKTVGVCMRERGPGPLHRIVWAQVGLDPVRPDLHTRPSASGDAACLP